MKVLVVHNDYQSQQIGGEDIVVNREIAGLKTALGEGQVFTYRVSNDTIRIGKLLKRLWGDRDHAKAIQTLIQKNNIDIVHVHNFFPLLTPLVFQAAKEVGATVIHTLHNFRWWCTAGSLYRPSEGHCMQCVNKSWGYPAVVHGCYRGSRLQSLAASVAFFWYHHKRYSDFIDAYFVLTEFQKKKIMECGLVEKLWLKPNPIEQPTTEMYPVTQKKDYLFVGRCEPEKGLSLLLDVWSTLPKNFTLHVIGDGPDRTRLEKTYSANNIRFYGNQPQAIVLEKMSKARYFMHSGLAYETFGLTIIEAMAQGTPVIGFNIGTRSELIVDGHNGWLTDPSDLKQVILNTALDEIAQYEHNNGNNVPQDEHNKKNDCIVPYAQMSAAAIASAKRFYLPTVIKHQIQLYRTLLEGKQASYDT